MKYEASGSVGALSSGKLCDLQTLPLLNLQSQSFNLSIFKFFNPIKPQNLSEKLSRRPFFTLPEYRDFYILQRWKTSSSRQENTDRQISKV
jgi:hypothetical protein